MCLTDRNSHLISYGLNCTFIRRLLLALTDCRTMKIDALCRRDGMIWTSMLYLYIQFWFACRILWLAEFLDDGNTFFLVFPFWKVDHSILFLSVNLIKLILNFDIFLPFNIVNYRNSFVNDSFSYNYIIKSQTQLKTRPASNSQTRSFWQKSLETFNKLHFTCRVKLFCDFILIQSIMPKNKE